MYLTNYLPSFFLIIDHLISQFILDPPRNTHQQSKIHLRPWTFAHLLATETKRYAVQSVFPFSYFNDIFRYLTATFYHSAISLWFPLLSNTLPWTSLHLFTLQFTHDLLISPLPVLNILIEKVSTDLFLCWNWCAWWLQVPCLELNYIEFCLLPNS